MDFAETQQVKCEGSPHQLPLSQFCGGLSRISSRHTLSNFLANPIIPKRCLLFLLWADCGVTSWFYLRQQRPDGIPRIAITRGDVAHVVGQVLNLIAGVEVQTIGDESRGRSRSNGG